MIYRKNEIMRLCEGKNVLHLGYIHQSDYQALIDEDEWLHQAIFKVADKVIGIDFLNKEILEIQEKLGYEGYFADVMELDKLKLEGTFDIIVCGELVNSIENPGLMFDGLKRFMHSESLIAISTPNPYSISRIFKVLMGKTDDKWVYSIAIMWQSYGTLINLAKRCGFTISFKGYYNGYEYKGSLKDIIKSMLPKRLQDGLFFTLKIK